ncbi:MAG: hypothetical protein RLP44_16435 [Aggregatilineales bacterium]
MTDETQSNSISLPEDDFDEEEVESQPYAPPVDQLLTLGRRNEITDVDYYDLGIRKKHVPELMRMVADESLHNAAWDDNGEEPLEVWAPIHAWRALAQMQAVQTAQHLIDHLFWRVDDDDDWVRSEMPLVFDIFGVKAIPPLMEYLNPEHPNGIEPRLLAIGCLMVIALHYDRADIVVGELLYQQLQRHAEHFPQVNARLAIALMGLKPDSTDLIDEATTAGHIDITYMTEIMLEIADFANDMMGEDFFDPMEADEFDEDDDSSLDPRFNPVRTMFPRKPQDAKAKKQKRKQAKQSRKKNRKK